MTIGEFRKTGHVSYSTGGESQYQAIINCPTHILHGKKVWKISYSRKNQMGEFGKSKTRYYLEESTKPFTSVEKLLSHYQIPNQ